jgi:RNA polymerase sigma-70 factor (ECF subfamily)
MPVEGVHDYADEELIGLLKAGRRAVFDEIYRRYWEKLYHYAFHNTQSKDLAFEMVHDIFVTFWTRRESLVLETSLSGYLFAAVRYQIIAWIRASRQEAAYAKDYSLFRAVEDNSTEDALHLQDLEQAIEQSLSQLPPRCQEIFRLSRREYKSVREIALELNISHRTVENQLTHALRHLRVSLGELLTMILLCAIV